MSLKTFERESKQIVGELTNLIEQYQFEQYDFHSIRQTLQDYIEKNYPNFNDYFKSDYIMMLIELFAFYGEMMAYRMDTTLNEVFLSTAKDRKNIIKLADMLGYKYKRIRPSYGFIKIDMTDALKGSKYFKKNLTASSSTDLINKKKTISFEALPLPSQKFFDYKLDYLLSTITTHDFLISMDNIFSKLEDFAVETNIKQKSVSINGVELLERSIIIPYSTRIKSNQTLYIPYNKQQKLFEIQKIEIDQFKYLSNNDTIDALTYSQNDLYSENQNIAIEYSITYDRGLNIVDKNIYMYVAVVQGASFSADLTTVSTEPNLKIPYYEENVFNDNLLIRQLNKDGTILKEYINVEDLDNCSNLFSFEVSNIPSGHIQLKFGDGKNAATLKQAAKTTLYYRKNQQNSSEVLNISNVELPTLSLTCEYFDNIAQKTQTVSLGHMTRDTLQFKNGFEEESNEQIKNMARKSRSMQDRFVSSNDYLMAGMLNPRVKHTNVILRSYIGKNSSRLSNESIDIFIDNKKQDISVFTIDSGSTPETYIFIPTAMFTESSITNKADYLTFIKNNKSYFFSIFDIDSISPNLWFLFNTVMLDTNNKGSIIKLTNQYLPIEELNNKINIPNIINVIGLNNTVISSNIDQSNNTLIISLNMDSDMTSNTKKINNSISSVKELIDAILSTFTISVNGIQVVIVKSNITFKINLNFQEIILPEDLSCIWTHYKSDDIHINPSKSNLIEIYVSAAKKDLQKDIEYYEELSPQELNELKMVIEDKKMISDMIEIYNSTIYSVKIALQIYKKKSSNITSDILKNRVDNIIDKFFDINNLPLGHHFYLSKLIEYLHTNINEIEYISPIIDSNGTQITPISTVSILDNKINYTQIIELHKIENGKRISIRDIRVD